MGRAPGTPSMRALPQCSWQVTTLRDAVMSHSLPSTQNSTGPVQHLTTSPDIKAAEGHPKLQLAVTIRGVRFTKGCPTVYCLCHMPFPCHHHASQIICVCPFPVSALHAVLCHNTAIWSPIQPPVAFEGPHIGAALNTSSTSVATRNGRAGGTGS